MRAAIVSDYHVAMNSDTEHGCTQCGGTGLSQHPPPAGVLGRTTKCPACNGTGRLPAGGPVIYEGVLYLDSEEDKQRALADLRRWKSGPRTMVHRRLKLADGPLLAEEKDGKLTINSEACRDALGEAP